MGCVIQASEGGGVIVLLLVLVLVLLLVLGGGVVDDPVALFSVAVALLAGLGSEHALMAAIKDLRLTSTGKKVPFNFISRVTVGKNVTGGLAANGCV